MDSRIIIATHKECWMPEDSIYVPVLVGAALKGEDELRRFSSYSRDDEGENISSKNKNYCELTGLYWAWNNLDASYLGLVHYRRHFTIRRKGTKQERVLNKKDLRMALRRSDILLPKKRKYYIETNYSQYVHAHHAADLDITRDIILEKYPEYVEAFDQSMKRTSGHRFNMFIMKADYFREYCEWLFDILFDWRKDWIYQTIMKMTAGFSDLLARDFLMSGLIQRTMIILELPYIFMEHQNWIIKGWNFLKRKFLGILQKRS